MDQAALLLLATEGEFTGFTSTVDMPRGVLAEVREPASSGGSALGGTAEPDDYYVDFTTRLSQLSLPRAGGVSGGGGAGWGALVISADYSSDSSDGSSSEDEPGGEGASGGDGEPLVSFSDFIIDAEGGRSTDLPTLGDFVADAEGGRSTGPPTVGDFVAEAGEDDFPDPGEMDETLEEEPLYGGPAPAGTILDFVSDA
jgi:hypothetical protein